MDSKTSQDFELSVSGVPFTNLLKQLKTLRTGTALELNAPISVCGEDICDYTDIDNLNQSLYKQKLMDATETKAR